MIPDPRQFIGRPIIDRCHQNRDDPQANAARWADPGALLLTVGPHDETALTGDPARLAPGPTRGRRDDQRQLFIGVVDGHPWFIVRGEPRPGPAGRVASLRGAALAPVEREIVWAGLAALKWHETAPVCPRCHGVTRASSGGLSRVCTVCGAVVFPRTDPAVISAVLDDRDRIVLARQPSWEAGRMSVIAGFVEAGEAAEHALAREVAEEAGLRVSAARYVSSQPWPFPRSLMMGYAARADGRIVLRDHELVEAHRFSRDEVLQRVAEGSLALPSPMSIARALVDSWLAGTLPGPESGVDLSVALGDQVPAPRQARVTP